MAMGSHLRLEASTIVRWVERCADVLEQQQESLNRLNVFPIPDADTGSNMHLTVRAATSAMGAFIAAERSQGHVAAEDLPSVAELCVSLAMGAVRGARGNSGLVLSQVFRALAEAASEGDIDADILPAMLHQAAGMVRAALSSPVEGTVLSVLTGAATGASEARQYTADLLQLVEATLEAARAALARTPEQLPVLRDAGVVDAGGQGLVLMLECLLWALDEHPADNQATHNLAERESELPAMDSQQHQRVEQCELEVMFSITAPEDQLRALLERHGNSIVIAPIMDGQWRAHVHTLQAGSVIEQAYALGPVQDLHLEVLPPQDPNRNERQRFALPFLAVLPIGSGLHELFRAQGIATISPHPTVQEMQTALADIGAPRVAVLLNGAASSGINEVLAALPADTATRIDMLDTAAPVGALAAIAVFDVQAEWDDNIDDMLEAVEHQHVCTLQGTTVDTLLPAITRLIDARDAELLTLIWDTTQVPASTQTTLIETLNRQYPELEIQSLETHNIGAAVHVGAE